MCPSAQREHFYVKSEPRTLRPGEDPAVYSGVNHVEDVDVSPPPFRHGRVSIVIIAPLLDCRISEEYESI